LSNHKNKINSRRNGLLAEPANHHSKAAENQLLSLHEGSIARYQLLPAEFQAWHLAWINT
jgi:hypothetical protein